MKKAFSLVLLAVMLASCMTACGGVDPEGSDITSETTTATTRLTAPEQSVNSLFSLPYSYNEDGVFNPILIHNDACDPLFALIYDGLFAVNTEGEAVPVLAQSITLEDNTAIIKLRENAFFHDGDTVKAADVVWSLKMAKGNQRSVYAGRFSNITDISARGSDTVVLTLEREQGSLEYMLTVPIIKNATGIMSNAIGSGRYRIVEQEESMYLVANESWFAIPEGGGFPTDLIILTYGNGLDDLVYSIVSGNANLVTLDPFIFADEKLGGNCDTYPVLTRDFYYIAFNTSYYAHTATSEVRNALALAIDIPAILESAYSGVVYSDGLYPESVTGVKPSVPQEKNERAATAGLRDAGYRFLAGHWVDSDGNTLEQTIVCGTASSHTRAAAIIAKNLEAIGVVCTIKEVDDVSAAISGGNFDIAVCHTTPSPDYDFSYLLAYEGAQNFNQYVVTDLDPKLDKFFEDGHRNSAETAKEINFLVNSAMPIIPLGYKQKTVCITREFGFGNIRVTAEDPFANLFEWKTYK